MVSVADSCLVPHKQRCSVVIKEERLRDVAIKRLRNRKQADALVADLAGKLTFATQPDAYLIALNVVVRHNEDNALGLNETEEPLFATALGSAWRG